jgi:hypothetical protein
MAPIKAPTIRRRAYDQPTATKVDLGHLSFIFSYDTLVAFWSHDRLWTVHENIWSNTTGRTLNAIDGGTKGAKSKRVDTETFERLLQQALDHENQRDTTRYTIGG